MMVWMGREQKIREHLWLVGSLRQKRNEKKDVDMAIKALNIHLFYFCTFFINRKIRF